MLGVIPPVIHDQMSTTILLSLHLILSSWAKFFLSSDLFTSPRRLVIRASVSWLQIKISTVSFMHSSPSILLPLHSLLLQSSWTHCWNGCNLLSSANCSGCYYGLPSLSRPFMHGCWVLLQLPNDYANRLSSWLLHATYLECPCLLMLWSHATCLLKLWSHATQLELVLVIVMQINVDDHLFKSLVFNLVPESLYLASVLFGFSSCEDSHLVIKSSWLLKTISQCWQSSNSYPVLILFTIHLSATCHWIMIRFLKPIPEQLVFSSLVFLWSCWSYLLQV